MKKFRYIVGALLFLLVLGLSMLFASLAAWIFAQSEYAGSFGIAG